MSSFTILSQADEDDLHAKRLLNIEEKPYKRVQKRLLAPTNPIQLYLRRPTTTSSTLADRETEKSSRTAQQLEMLDSLIQQAMNLANTAPSRSKQEANVKAQREIGGIVKNLSPYPEEEIHWLVTKMWNMAIEFHGIEQNEVAKRWAAKAVQMAEIGARGEGVMVRVVDQLRGNIKQLGWDI